MKTHANLKDLPCGTAKGLKVRPGHHFLWQTAAMASIHLGSLCADKPGLLYIDEYWVERPSSNGRQAATLPDTYLRRSLFTLVHSSRVVDGAVVHGCPSRKGHPIAVQLVDMRFYHREPIRL